MEQQKTVVFVGIGAMMLALVLRLATGGAALSLRLWQVPAFFQPSDTVQATFPTETDPPPTESPTESLQIAPSDGDPVQLHDLVGYGPDVQALLQTPLVWDLRSDAPTVLILHTHGSESYTKQPTETYIEESPYQTYDARYNMISLGQELAHILEAGGIRVIHDQMLHDHPSYSDAYDHARQSIASYLAAYPSIQMVIDLHRDALDFAQDPQLSTSAQVNGQESAQIMLVAGTDVNLDYPDWQDNLSLGVKLTAVLEKAYPGITRPIQLRAQRFNLDMTPGSLLVEIGANGDTHTQALTAVRALGEAILTLADGANLQNGPPF